MKTKPKKVAPAKRRTHVRLEQSVLTCPCPKCGSPSRVRRVTLGERTRLTQSRPNYVLRERRCIGPAHHHFHTEERSR